MKQHFIPAIVLFVLLACRESQTRPTVDRFSWLQGSWEMPMQEGRVTEAWTRVNDSLMEGRSDFVVGDSVMPFETVRLERRGEGFVYEVHSATHPGETPVVFRLSSFSDSGFVAEDPAHDFPKRILYRLVTADSIFARVDGGPADSAHKDEFRYSRRKK